MRVPSTEVQNNFGKYINIALENEEVIVTRNGKDIIKLVPCINDELVCERAENYLAGENPRMTYEEFVEMAEKSDLRYEFIDGEVFLMSSPNYAHQTAVVEILVHFYNWFKGKNYRPLTSPFDVTLFKSNDNINVVQPDIIVICDTDNMNEKGKYKGVPTLVVEVLSDTTRRHDMVRKLELYMQTGIREYWIVNPFNKEIYVHNFESLDITDYRVFTGNASVKSLVFEGLEITLADIFTF